MRTGDISRTGQGQCFARHEIAESKYVRRQSRAAVVSAAAGQVDGVRINGEISAGIADGVIVIGKAQAALIDGIRAADDCFTR